MHKVIPISCLNECIICYNKTFNKNSCDQCKICVLCNDCLKKKLETCPICRKENFYIEKTKQNCCTITLEYHCSILKKTIGITCFAFICFLFGSFVKLMSGTYQFHYIDFLLNTLLGMVVIGLFITLFICMDICLFRDLKDFLKFWCNNNNGQRDGDSY